MPVRTASCSCGQLLALTSAEPGRVSVCHCLACQRRAGSVFGAQARFPANSFTFSGASKRYVRIGDEGSRAIVNFCPAFGASVYNTIEGREELIAIPVGAFAEPSSPGPIVSVRLSKHPLQRRNSALCFRPPEGGAGSGRLLRPDERTTAGRILRPRESYHPWRSSTPSIWSIPSLCR